MMEEFIRIIYSEKTINTYNKKIKLFGIGNTYNTYNILGIKFFTSIILFIVLLYITKFGYIIAPVVVFIYHYLFDYVVLDLRIKKREYDIEKEAIHFFEVLTLSIDTGRNLLEAIITTTDNVNGTLYTNEGTTSESVSNYSVNYGVYINGWGTADYTDETAGTITANYKLAIPGYGTFDTNLVLNAVKPE